jgi:hypothetical protein
MQLVLKPVGRGGLHRYKIDSAREIVAIVFGTASFQRKHGCTHAVDLLGLHHEAAD